MICNPGIYSKGIAVGLAVSLLLHVSGLAWLGKDDSQPAPVVVEARLVGFVPPAAESVPAPEKITPPARPEPKQVEKSKSWQRLVKAPTKSAQEPKPASEALTVVSEAAVETPVRTPRLMTPSTEHAIVCPDQAAPAYPSISRRLGEEGVVILKVELDESGGVSNAQVASSSGYPRLDESARMTVSSWRCSPSLLHGQPVRMTAMQPFKFMLQGN